LNHTRTAVASLAIRCISATRAGRVWSAEHGHTRHQPLTSGPDDIGQVIRRHAAVDLYRELQPRGALDAIQGANLVQRAGYELLATEARV